MTPARPNPVLRALPSLADVAFLMPVVFLFTRMDGMGSLLADGDTGWHIRAGDWIRTHGQVPRADIFSYTKPGQPWYAWEWLWDAGASWVHERWGLAGVALVSLFIICLTFGLLYRLIYRRCQNPLVSIGLTVLAASGSTVHWLARPHLFTLFLTVIFMLVLDRVRDGKPGLLWLLPALTILWTNLHGGFLSGIILLGAYGAGELVRALLAPERAERLAALRGSVPYLATAAACLGASLVNPYGYGLHTHIRDYLRDSYSMQNIQEFQSADFHHGAAVFWETMLVLGVGAAAWFVAHRRFAEPILILGWAHLGLVAVRNMPIFLLVAAPVVAMALVEALRALSGARLAAWVRKAAGAVEAIGSEIAPMERVARLHVVPAAALLLAGLAVSSPAAQGKFKAEFDVKRYPAAALHMLEGSERIFTDDEWGDYLIYRLFPAGKRVYIDGRSDFYGEEFCREYTGLVNVKYDWKETLDKHRVDAVLLRTSEPLAGAIKESERWRVVYDDGSAIVFRRAEPSASVRKFSTSSTGGKNRSEDTTGRIFEPTLGE
jgi:hypothetical protein